MKKLYTTLYPILLGFIVSSHLDTAAQLNALPEEEKEQQEKSTDMHNKKKDWKKKIVPITVILCLCAGGGIGLFYLFKKSEASTADSQNILNKGKDEQENIETPPNQKTDPNKRNNPPKPKKKTNTATDNKQNLINISAERLKESPFTSQKIKDSKGKVISLKKVDLKKVRGNHHVSFPPKNGKVDPNFKVPTLLDIAWLKSGGYIRVKALDHKGQPAVFEGKEKDSSTRADCILSPTGIEHWNWKKTDKTGKRPNDISHHPGHKEEMINYILDKDKKITHLILSTGWDNVFRVLGEKRGEKGTLSDNTKKNLQDIVVNKLGIKIEDEKDKEKAREKVKIVTQYPKNNPKLDSSTKIIIYVLDTESAAHAYKELSQDENNRVIAVLHTTC